MDDLNPSIVEWQQYPDSTIRETYPPLPRKGLGTNVPLTDQMAGNIAARLPAQVQQQIAEAQASITVPDDPALAEYKAAGWL